MGRVLRVGTPVDVSAATGTVVLALDEVTSARYTWIKRWGIYMRGTSATATPIVCAICRFSALGASAGALAYSTTGGAYFCGKQGTIGTTPETTARYGVTAGVTVREVLHVFCVHPQGGYESVEGADPIPVGNETGTEFFGIYIVEAPTAVNCRAMIEFEE